MKSLLYFLLGILILGLTLVSLFLGGVLFDVAGSATVNAFIFQPNNLADMRVGPLLSLDQVSEKFVRERLIRRFVTEYFYVIPDVDNVAERQKAYSVMDAMATRPVFDEWRMNVVPELENLATRHSLRRVVILDILKMDEYYAISYDLITWDAPNILGTEPSVNRGVIYLQLDFINGIRERIDNVPFDVGRFLEKGGDPAVIFEFKVRKIVK